MATKDTKEMLGKQLGMLKTAEGPIKPIEKSAKVSIAELKEEEVKAQINEEQNTMSDEQQEENNDLDSTTKKKKKSAKAIRIEKQIAVYNSNIKILEEKLAEEEDETSPEATNLKNEIEEAKKKKEELEISLLEAEQEEELSKEDEERQRIEVSKRMLSMDEEEKEQEKEQPKELIIEDTAQNSEIEIELDPRLAQLQQHLQTKGIFSTIEGNGNMQYLKTDQAGLEQLDPNTTSIEQIDQTLEQQAQEMAIQQAMKETEEDKARRAEAEKERIMNDYVNSAVGSRENMPPMPSSS